MSKVEVTHVENGYIVTVTKFDIVDQRPKTVITVWDNLDEVIEHLKAERV